MDQPKSQEDREERNRKYLEDIQKRWDRACQHLKLNINEWQADELLRQGAEAFLRGDTAAQAEAAERIRIFIAHALLQRAKTTNNPDAQSSNAEPMGSMRVQEADIEYGKVKLPFFSGTSGERVLVSLEGLRLPWVRDEKLSSRTTNILLRNTMKELFSSAEGADGQDLLIPFRR